MNLAEPSMLEEPRRRSAGGGQGDAEGGAERLELAES